MIDHSIEDYNPEKTTKYAYCLKKCKDVSYNKKYRCVQSCFENFRKIYNATTS